MGGGEKIKKTLKRMMCRQIKKPLNFIKVEIVNQSHRLWVALKKS